MSRVRMTPRGSVGNAPVPMHALEHRINKLVVDNFNGRAAVTYQGNDEFEGKVYSRFVVCVMCKMF